MSDRERWIVYPLLFLAIGLAMRNDLAMQDEEHGGEVDVVRCKALEVVGPEGKPTATISTNSNGDGFLETGSASGEVQTRLGANVSGATLELLDRAGKLYALVGHDADRVGFFVGDTESGKLLPLFAPIVRTRTGEQNSATPEKTPEAQRNSAAPDKPPAPSGNSTDKPNGSTTAPARK